MLKVLKFVILTILIVFIAPVLVHAAIWLTEERPASWRHADWSSAGILPIRAQSRNRASA